MLLIPAFIFFQTYRQLIIVWRYIWIYEIELFLRLILNVCACMCLHVFLYVYLSASLRVLGQDLNSGDQQQCLKMAAEGGSGGSTPTNSLPPPGTGGYSTEIFSSGFDHKFICSHCKRILRDPLQSYCGHRFCRVCCQELLGYAISSAFYQQVYYCSFTSTKLL